MQAESGTLRKVRHRLARLWREDREERDDYEDVPEEDADGLLCALQPERPAVEAAQQQLLDSGSSVGSPPTPPPEPPPEPPPSATTAGRSVHPRRLLRHVLHHRSLGSLAQTSSMSSVADSCDSADDVLDLEGDHDDAADASDEDAGDEHGGSGAGQSKGDGLFDKIGQKLRSRGDRVQKVHRG